MTAVKDKMIQNNNTINWMPESIGQAVWRLAEQSAGLGSVKRPLLGYSSSYLGM